MSSCEDISSIQTWIFSNAFPTSWTSDEIFDIDSLINQTSSTTSGSDPEPTVSKHAQLPPPPRKKVSKRKSRISKRSPTTYINADVENFRQLVQQVTGVRFGAGPVHNNVGSVVKPEAHRPQVGLLNRVDGPGVLPTLDTSAFVLDHHQEVVGPSVDCGPRFEFDGLSSFPTLDSWKVM